MVGRTAEKTPRAPFERAWLVGATVAIGFLLGAAVSLLAFYVARYGPTGDGWSFKGNGAIAAYSVFPAVLAAGWTALVLHFRAHRGWLAWGSGAGLVGVLLALAGAAMLPVFGTIGDRVGSPIALLTLVLWTVAAPIVAIRLRVAGSVAPSPVAWPVFAGLAWFMAAVAGLVLVGVLIPAGS